MKMMLMERVRTCDRSHAEIEIFAFSGVEEMHPLFILTGCVNAE